MVDGIHLLTGGAETDSDQLRSRMGSIVRAGARAFDAVIVDVGRRALPQAVAERTDQILLVARPTPRAAAAASRLIESVPPQPVAVMTNGRPASGWGPDEMSHQLGTEIVADLAEQRWLRAADEPAEAYEVLRAAPGARLIGNLLERLMARGSQSVGRLHGG